ncbi:MAG: tetratricopeptide repeat protein [Mastigocoleus sp. MO_167.B18]|nr:tetratricopeptide repeat protein [Mastigocoleus sp. MO_167.B18]
MIKQVTDAFKTKDYRTAAKLIKKLLKESPEDPWVLFHLGQLYEVTEKYQEAEKVYRQLLRHTVGAKIVIAAREALQRLEKIQEQKRKEAIAEATSKPDNTEQGVLVLEALNNEIKTQAAQKFAQIMQIDAYSARLLLPSRGWRLYRSGMVGELKFYGQQLLNATIPCFWAKLADIQKIQVFQVNYFTQLDSKATVVCHDRENRLGSLSFDWSEVKQCVKGLLPIFEEVVDRDVRGKLERKTQTQDYFQFYDLHLPNRNCILRLYDNGYEYQQGINIAPQNSQNTIRINWNNLLTSLEKKLQKIQICSDFNTFAENILDRAELLNKIQPHINLIRREKTNWDAAFQLYSGLAFVKNSH